MRDEIRCDIPDRPPVVRGDCAARTALLPKRVEPASAVSLGFADEPIAYRDYLGELMPPGYVAWECDICTAICNFEAMKQCARRHDLASECGFDRDQPESNGGAFGFMKRVSPAEGLQPSPQAEVAATSGEVVDQENVLRVQHADEIGMEPETCRGAGSRG